MDKVHECTKCGEQFHLSRSKPGKINECWSCGSKSEKTPRLGGNMIYTGKQAPEIEIKTLKEARKFNAKTRRLGAGVTASICTSKKQAEKSLFRNGQWMKDEPLEEEE